jgi:MATE family multidrug resistance protein
MGPSDKKLHIGRIISELPSLIKLSVPLVLGLSASSLIGVTDTFMLSPLGTDVLAIVSLVMAVHMLLTAMLYGVISVVGVSMAGGFGAKDACMVSSAVRHGMMTALICGALAATIMLALMPIARLMGLPEMQALLGTDGAVYAALFGLFGAEVPS